MALSRYAQESYTPCMSIDFKHATLPNGLTVIAEVSPGAHTAAIGFFVKTGARDEDGRIMGVSHFLEHMMFKGTAKRTATDVDRELDDLGVEHNAFTTAEMTAFWAHGLPDRLPAAAEVVADFMRPALREQDFEAEKNVILEEIAMYRDHPFWVLYERAMEEHYAGPPRHPLSHRVLGTPETVSAMTREQMLDYFTKRYSADNTVVALAGRVDFEPMVERISEWCGSWERTQAQREFPPIKHDQREFTMELPTVNRHYLFTLAPGPAIDDDDRYAAGVLAQILGDADGSRLYWALIETGLAEEAQAWCESRDGVGEMMTYASCPPTEAERVEEILLREIDALSDSLTEDDLERVRSKLATAATLQGELPAGRMKRLGHVWTYLGRYRSLEEELARINAVTLSALREVAAKWPFTPVTTGRMKPGGQAAAQVPGQ
jgi:predicted Zn-dependent peptidase